MKLFLTFLLLLPMTGLADEAATPTIVDGIIEGAPFQLAVPGHRNGNLLIHAHGLRPADSPLVAELELEDTAYGQLVANGWMVAMTAYRRNGMIIADAMTDVINLRNRVEEDYGPLILVLIDGQSMGGAIVTYLAESRPGSFNGALAIGAALRARDPQEDLNLTYRPRIPLLFLSNRSEITQPEIYVAKAADAPVPPILWSLNRDGHVNLNEAERLIAVDGLVEWIATGQITGGRDITVEMVSDENAVSFDSTGAGGRVVDITHNYGNVFIDFTEEDFNRIGIQPGDDFILRVGQVTVVVRYGTTFSDVPRGGWIAFATADGNTIVAINHGNAFEQLRPEIGDAVRIEPLN